MRNIQATGNLYGKRITVKQISKAAAAKLFAAGKEVYLQSSNMHPFGIWQQLCPIKFDQYDYQYSIDFSARWPDSPIKDAGYQFTQIVNEYKWYNCDGERGKYVHFYTAIN